MFLGQVIFSFAILFNVVMFAMSNRSAIQTVYILVNFLNVLRKIKGILRKTFDKM